MKKEFLSRQYLESVSTANLITIADDYGIDIPDDLNRKFIIEELLDIQEESLSHEEKEEEEMKEDDKAVLNTLPKSYNHTKINAVLRNPAWAFVFWDIKESDITALKKSGASLSLRILFFETEDSDEVIDTITNELTLADREQYVLIPAGRKYFVANLEYIETPGQNKVLAYSPRIQIPYESEALKSYQPGKKIKMNKLAELSGMEELLRQHYKCHRQSF